MKYGAYHVWLRVEGLTADERQAMWSAAGHLSSSVAVTGRSLIRRRVAYYGNVSVLDTIRTSVSPAM